MHPIVQQTQPSAEQAPAVIGRGQDIVVTAGAGTGKTRALIGRYLSLLADGKPLRSVVAITFTNKAAREMRNRVREEIRRYLASPGLDPPEHELWQKRYVALDAARISTIHSLCTEILRSHPAEARVDPRFEVLDEGQARILAGRALDETMAWAADDPVAGPLFGLLRERGLRATLADLLGRRLAAQQVWDSLPDDLLGHWQQVLAARQAQALDRMLADKLWSDVEGVLRSNAARDADDLMEVQRRVALAALTGAEGTLADRLASLALLGAIKLTGGRQAAWPGGKQQLDEVKTALRTLRDCWKAEAALLQLGLTDQDRLLAAAAPALRLAFETACRRYAALRDERNALDFDDLEVMALALLRTNPSVQQRWQQEVQAILVDEFQDTNGRQRDLVALLNGGQGKLLIVGDAKQSIYRFRGADVTVFRDERRRVERGGGQSCTLATSYRAHAALVRGLNALLRPVLGSEDNPQRPWVEPFSPLAPFRQQPAAGLTGPYIELHLTAGKKSDGALDRAAQSLAARLVASAQQGIRLESGGKTRPLGYGDMAILCRASSSFPPYEDALEQVGVPFLTVGGLAFYDRPEVRDLLNALQALADPTDDLALVGLLRSPVMGISDPTLWRLCRARADQKWAGPLWTLLPALDWALLGEDASRLARAASIISELGSLAGRVSVAELLKTFLERTDYRAALAAAGQARSARNVSKLLADAHTSAIVGVGEFLEYLTDLRGSGAREGEARAAAEGVVQIMSVHAAKGLEFPIVAIGDMTFETPHRSATLVDPELGVLLGVRDADERLPAAFQLGRQLDADQESAESARLLYVASTRAQEMLLLSGCIRMGQGAAVGRLTGWLERISGEDGLGLAGATLDYDPDGDQARLTELSVGGEPILCALYEPGFQAAAPPAAPRRAKQPVTPSLPVLLAPVVEERQMLDQPTSRRERAPQQRVWRVVPRALRPRAPAWVVGSLVHQALAAWRFPSPAYAAWAQALARSLGLTDARQLADAAAQSARLLTRFRRHPLFEEMDTAERRLAELPYSYLVDGQLDSGIMDSLYYRDGQWTLVEFKTDEVRTEDALQELLAQQDYVAQAARYAAACRDLLGEQPRVLLCLLNYQRRLQLYEPEVSGQQHPARRPQAEGEP